MKPNPQRHPLLYRKAFQKMWRQGLNPAILFRQNKIETDQMKNVKAILWDLDNVIYRYSDDLNDRCHLIT